MQPRFPVLRSLVTALVLAVVAAAAVAAVARLTLPAHDAPAGAMPVVAGEVPEGSPSDTATGSDGEGTGTSGDVSADPTTADSSAGDTGTGSDAPGDSTASSPGDSVAAAVDSAAAAVGTATGTAPDPAPAPSVLAAIMEEVTTAPERWLVLAAFVATFIAACLTALIAVNGSAPRVVEEGPVHRRSDAVQLLAVLQREGRLVDFLREEIEPFTDAQIGAAVRAVHAGCRKALDDHMMLAPVSAEQEGAETTVAEGFDPSAIRLTGNVAGEPPFTGKVRHRGWRASELDLPTDARGQDPEIVAPAEVEIS